MPFDGATTNFLAPLTFPTKEEFDAWLRQQHPDTVIGYANLTGACPLARYLITHGAEYAEVDPGEMPLWKIWRNDSWWTVNNRPTEKMPRWARRFANMIDEIGGQIRAEDALTVLRQS